MLTKTVSIIPQLTGMLGELAALYCIATSTGE